MLEGQFFGRIFRLHTRPGRSARKALLAPLRAGALTTQCELVTLSR